MYFLIQNVQTFFDDFHQHDVIENAFEHFSISCVAQLCLFNAFETRNSAMKSNNIIALGVRLS